MDLVIALANPRAADVAAVLERHMDVMRADTPPAHVHALPAERLQDPAVSLFGARRGGMLVGIGAIRQLDSGHAEIKSMHTVAEARGQGVGRAVLRHLLQVARTRGYQRVSLETGTMPAFEPARAMYRAAGFERCAPFGEYTRNPFSICMSLVLRGEPPSPAGLVQAT